MDFLNILIGCSVAIWVLIGIKMHASWIADTFLNEIDKINFQQGEIENNGYSSISFDKNLRPQKSVVYGYWENLEKSIDDQRKTKRSPIIFRLVSINLIIFTAIFVLIIVSKGLFSIIGIH